MRSHREYGFAAALTALGVIGALLGGCGQNVVTNTITRTVVQATPSPPTWVPQSTFTVSQTGAAASTMPLPSGGGFTGSISTGATIQKYTQATRTLTDVQPQIAPLGSRRKPADVVPGAILAYAGLLFDAGVPSSTFAMTLQIPQAAYVSGAQYYLALWDPLRPTLGWQHGFAGPATVSTSGATPSLTFSASSAPLFVRFQQYWVAAYMIPNGVPAPTAAPSIAPLPDPTQQPGTIAAIQTQMSEDQSCSGTPCATGPIPAPTQGPTDHNVFIDQKNPSLSGASTELQILPRDEEEGDVLYYTPPLPGDFALATQFTWDFWFRVDQDVWTTVDGWPSGGPKPLNALEFDFNKGMPGTPGYNYNFSSQCYMGDPTKTGGPQWQVWGLTDKGTNNWVNAGIPCHPEAFTANTWHHIVWKYRIYPDTLTAEYVSLAIDGGPEQVPTMNATHSADEIKVQAHSTLEVQFQQDARKQPSPPPFNEWVDNVMLGYQ